MTAAQSALSKLALELRDDLEFASGDVLREVL
jgi:hypothetical protein